MRFCLNFRYLNAETIPRTDDILSELEDAKVFKHLVPWINLLQVPLRRQNREKTGFACNLGVYQLKSMPFRLCNVSATFQRLMAQTLTSVTKKYGNLILRFMDNLVKATFSLEDHIE